MLTKKFIGLVALLFISGGVWFYVQGMDTQSKMMKKEAELPIPELNTNADATAEIDALIKTDVSDIDQSLEIDLSDLE